ncbi:hypothetical protein [Methylorubrum extorquens]|jgi:nickel/cobalt transporter (NiCoT) family protein|uniref:hypothetical protein n=1 Tax=Methylorubrum extorquens TaxID=408 RepID=UPI001EE5E6CA|nr:hypothetical protein [Methylorubrum extorquens]MCG5248098.1 hypothetical protein [Methylorubrum extorquens]
MPEKLALSADQFGGSGSGLSEAIDMVAERLGARNGLSTWFGGIPDHYDTLGFAIIGAFMLA